MTMSYTLGRTGSTGIRAGATLPPRAGSAGCDEYDRSLRENSMHARFLVPLALLAAATPALAAEERELVHHELTVTLSPTEHGIRVRDRIHLPERLKKGPVPFRFHAGMELIGQGGAYTPHATDGKRDGAAEPDFLTRGTACPTAPTRRGAATTRPRTTPSSTSRRSGRSTTPSSPTAPSTPARSRPRRGSSRRRACTSPAPRSGSRTSRTSCSRTP